jgi:UDP-2,4-diacetamido-2,4,6-trideoxy-beta-L-altropyranose hydrolase
MRCLALAQEWEKMKGGFVAFFSKGIPEPLFERITSEVPKLKGIVPLTVSPGSTEDSDAVIKAAREEKATVVVDGYQFDAAYQRRLKDAGLRVLWIDDYGHAKPYAADLVLNQNLGAYPVLYADRAANTRLLLGARYVLLRQEFLKWQSWERAIEPAAKKVLVTLGGSDPFNITLRVLEALPPSSDLEVTVLAGASNPNLESLRTHCAANERRFVVDAPNMPELMAEADMAVTGGGTTVWESAFMGLPALLVVLADNQVAGVDQAHAAGFARSLGRAEQLTPEKISEAVGSLLADHAARVEMSSRGRKLIDGHGAFRVCLNLKENSLRLAPPTEKDSRLLWEWANDPYVRAVSFSTAAISWQDHARWFEKRMSDSNCRLWVARNGAGEPVGQARFDITGKSAVMSVSLGKMHRGKNLGAPLIWITCRKLFAETRVTTVEALIKAGNDASLRAFQKVGFEKTGTKEVNGHAALVFTLTKDRA